MQRLVEAGAKVKRVVAKRGLRLALVLGAILAALGLGRVVYFTCCFDTWVMQHVPAPEDRDVLFEEAVLVPSAELEIRAGDGTAAAWRVAALGGTLSIAAGVGLWLDRRRASGK